MIGDTLRTYLNPLHRKIELPPLPFDFAAVSRLTISACGTASLAGMVGKCWLEQLARLPSSSTLPRNFVIAERRYPRWGDHGHLSVW